MRLWKSILITFLLGLYFINITPAHFYAHNDLLAQEHSTHEDTDDVLDCDYMKFVASGQGLFFNPLNTALILDIQCNHAQYEAVDSYQSLKDLAVYRHLTLRGPPALA